MGDLAGCAIQKETREFLERDHQLFIGGEWVKSSGTEIIDVVDPATEQSIASVQAGDSADIDLAVDAARTAFESNQWSGMSPSTRVDLLLRLADLIQRDAQIITELEILDNGMPLNPGGAMAAPLAVRLFRYYAGWVDKIGGASLPVETPRSGRGATAYTRKEPIGVVGQITPWNYPLGMIAMKLGPALAAGCTVVLKPAEQTPLSALYIAGLIKEAGFPPGVANLVPGYGETAGAALAGHNGVDKVAFTGSTAVGKSIVNSATGNLKKVSLELGGKSPFVVFADADIAVAAQMAAFSSFFLQGQNCMCSSRILVQEQVYGEFISALSGIAAKMKIGHGLSPDTQIGPLISEEQRNRVLELITSGKTDGAEVIAGGNAVEGAGFFLQPTVFAGTGQNMRIAREEIFGPVTCVQKFTDIEEAVSLANATDYGLVGSVWTEDLHTAHTMASAIKAGTVGVNNHGLADITLPFGGYKQSGWGREFGPEGLELYLQTKTVSVHF
jgi:phenylacetaldehyde dehydrogenase